MVAFGHSAVGASIGVLTYSALGGNNPVVGLLVTGTVGVISHYICDAIPHGHFVNLRNLKSRIFHIIVLDLFLSVLLLTLLDIYTSGFSQRVIYLLFGMGGALLPDVVDTLIHIKLLPKVSILKLEYNFHAIWLHWHGSEEKGLPIGIRDLWQVATVFIAIYLILTLV